MLHGDSMSGFSLIIVRRKLVINGPIKTFDLGGCRRNGQHSLEDVGYDQVVL